MPLESIAINNFEKNAIDDPLLKTRLDSFMTAHRILTTVKPPLRSSKNGLAKAQNCT